MGEQADKNRGLFIVNKNIITPPENELVVEARKLEEEKKAKTVAEKLKQVHLEKLEEVKSKLETLEILPIRDKVIILPYPQNPYMQTITESGIFVDTMGQFFNPDSGKLDQMNEMVVCGKVIEVGPECRWVQVGDDVYYDSRTAFPFPFMNNGYKLTSEVSLLAILNENLKERLKNGNK